MSRLSVSPVRKPSVDIVKLTDVMLHLSAYNVLYFNTLRRKLTDDRRFAKKDFAYNRTPYDRKLVTVKALISNPCLKHGKRECKRLSFTLSKVMF